jgi:hypothetical protein
MLLMEKVTKFYKGETENNKLENIKMTIQIKVLALRRIIALHIKKRRKKKNDMS